MSNKRAEAQIDLVLDLSEDFEDENDEEKKRIGAPGAGPKNFLSYADPDPADS